MEFLRYSNFGRLLNTDYRADGWECSQGEWTKTVHVLHHFKEELDQKYGTGTNSVRLLLLCGGDVVESITKFAVSEVMLWNHKQVRCSLFSMAKIP